MQYFINKQLKKKLEKPEYVWLGKKLTHFADEVDKVKGIMNELPLGFWVRKICGTDIYKFRLNNGDRMLFSFIDHHSDSRKAIAFLDYCTHDQQIYTARRTNVHSKIPQNIEIGQRGYIEEEELFDQSVEREYRFAHSGAKLDETQISLLAVENDAALKKLIEMGDDELVFQLSKAQFECLKRREKPVILTGSAGTGKTMIAIHKLLALAEENKKGLYTTYTKSLADEAAKLFEANNRHSNQLIDIVDINQLLCGFCDKSKKRLVNMNRFFLWFARNCHNPRKEKFSQFDLWAEIRGILKGHINDFSDMSKVILPLDYYINNLPKGYSRFDKIAREDVYAIACEYNEWLRDNGFFDENDLAQMYLANTVKGFYDTVIIDEVQDLSETQIFALRNLARSSNNVMILGDIRQNVQSSFFSFGRIRSQFFATGIMAEEHHLTKNYRSQSRIVKICNKLLDTQKKIAALQQPYNIPESYIFEGGTSEIIDDEVASSTHLLELLLNSPQSAVIVADEKDALAAEEKFRELLKDKYVPSGRIFAVPEVKGLEFKRVVCFNLVGRYTKELHEILEANVKESSWHQHILSLFYVAISRACETLIFYEQDKNHPFLKYILHNDETVCDDDNTQESLSVMSKRSLAKESSEVGQQPANIQSIAESLRKEDRSKKSWLREADRYQRNGNYKQALEIYGRLNLQTEYNQCLEELETMEHEMIEMLRKQGAGNGGQFGFENIVQGCDFNPYPDPKYLSAGEKFDYHIKQSQLFASRQNYSGAFQAVQNALLIKQDPALYGLCGLYSFHNNDFQQAIDYFTLAHEKGAMDPEMYVFRASSFSALGNPIAALGDCNRAEMLGCSDSFFYETKASILYSLQQFKKAIPCFQKACNSEPRNLRLRGMLINCYVFIGEYNLALNEAEKMERQNPRTPFVVGLSILTLLKMNRMDSAKKKCQQYKKVLGITQTVDELYKDFQERANKWDAFHLGQDWVTTTDIELENYLGEKYGSLSRQNNRRG